MTLKIHELPLTTYQAYSPMDKDKPIYIPSNVPSMNVPSMNVKSTIRPMKMPR